MSHIMRQVEDEAALRGEGDKLSTLRELMHPSNRKRIILGMIIMVFMQFAGSNAIK